MRLELTRVGLPVELANHYTTKGALELEVFVAFFFAWLWKKYIINLNKFIYFFLK